MRGILSIVCCSLWLGMLFVSSLASDAAEDSTSEASANSTEQPKDLAKRYAELYGKAHLLLKQLRELKLSTAHMLNERSAGAAGKRIAHLVERQQRLQKAHKALYRQLKSFRTYLKTSLGTLNASETMQNEVLSRYQRVLEQSNRLAESLPQVAERGGGKTGKGQCRVLAIAPDLNTVALEVGTAQGAYPGMLWRIDHGERSRVKLKLVETRRAISAAIVIRGDIKAIEKGDTATCIETEISSGSSNLPSLPHKQNK